MSLFDQPSALALLLVLPALWLLGKLALREREGALRRFGDPEVLRRSSPLPPASAPLLPTILRWTGLVAAVLALARPQLGRDKAPLARTGRDIIVALDLSRSMKTQDVGGDRLGVAKRLAWRLASAHPGDRIGLVIFGGAAFLQLPPTTDLGTFQAFLDAASPDDVTDPATDVAAALKVAERSLRREGTSLGSRAVLLVSDGERSEGPLDPIFELYRRARLPVFAVGVGTPDGGRVPADSGAAEGPWHVDNIGRPVISRLAEEDLRQIGLRSNGAYARWDDAAALDRLGKALGNLEARALASQPASEPVERYQWPLALAVSALVLEALLGMRRRRPDTPRRDAPARLARRGLTAALPLVALFLLSCGTERAQLVKGQQLYDKGQYKEAFLAWDNVLKQQGGAPVQFNAANALYRMRQYSDAAKAWRQAINADDQLREDGYFNIGNAFVRDAEDANLLSDHLTHAIEAYEAALQIDPNDKDAKWNLEIALRKRGDVNTGGSRGRGGRADYGRGNMREEGYDENRQAAVGAMAGGGQGGDEGESVDELNESDARSLLEAVERQQLSSHEGRRAKTGHGANRDW